MMPRLLVISLAALLLGVGVVAMIETDPGYVLIVYGNYTLETSLWVALVLLALGLLALYLAVLLSQRLIGGRRSLRSWLTGRRGDAAQRHTIRGLISFFAGDLQRARRELERGAGSSPLPLVNWLLAARASDSLRDSRGLSRYLDAAVAAQPAAEPIAAISRAEAALHAGDLPRALAALAPVEARAARYPRVLSLKREILEGLGDWDALAELLPQLRRHKLFPEEELQQLERRLSGRRLAQARTPAILHGAWQALPAALRQERELLQLYVARQVDLGDDAGAQKTILRGLKVDWDPVLVRQYGLLESDGAAARLARAERWLEQHPEDPELLLALGRLCLREKLWGKARYYFESCYRLQVSGEICAELGRLLVRLGEPKVGAAYYREGLAVHQSGLPELPMPDRIAIDHRVVERS